MTKHRSFYCGFFFLIFSLLITSGCQTTGAEDLTPSADARLTTGQADLPLTHAENPNTPLGQLQKKGVLVKTEGQHIQLTLAPSRFFEQNSPSMTQALIDVLGSLTQLMEDSPYSIATIQYKAFNGEKKALVLGKERTQTLIAYLESQGIPGNRLISGVKPQPTTMNSPVLEITLSGV